MKTKYGPYSPSRLDTAACGYSFKKQYIDKDPRSKEESVVQARGAAVHEILEQMTNEFKGNKEATFSRGRIQALVADAVKRHPNAYEQTDTLLNCAEMYLKRPPGTLVEDAETELRLAVKYNGEAFVECDYNDPQAFARGRADIMMISDDTTTALVYDHKTQMNIETADTFQMGFYAWVISKIYPFLREVHLVLHFAQYGYYSRPIIYLTKWDEERVQSLSKEERETYRSLEAIESEIMTKVRIVEERTEWDACPHNLCQYCPYLCECPLMTKHFEVDEKTAAVKPTGLPEKVTDMASAMRVAESVYAIELYAKELKKGLSSWAKDKPPVLLSNSRIFYGYKPSFGHDWGYLNKQGRAKVLEICEKYKVDPQVWMGFSSTVSKKILNHDNRTFVNELMTVLPEKTTTKFGGYKA